MDKQCTAKSCKVCRPLDKKALKEAIALIESFAPKKVKP